MHPLTVQPYRAEPKAGEAGPKSRDALGAIFVAPVTRFGLEPAPRNWFPRGSVWGSFRHHSRHQPCRHIKLEGAYIWGLNPSRSIHRRLYREDVHTVRRRIRCKRGFRYTVGLKLSEMYHIISQMTLPYVFFD